jgi:hypothetical protein
MSTLAVTYYRAKAGLYYGNTAEGDVYTIWHDTELGTWFGYEGHLTPEQANITQHAAWDGKLHQVKETLQRMHDAKYRQPVQPSEVSNDPAFSDDVVETVTASNAARILIAAGFATFDSADDVLRVMVRSLALLPLPQINGQSVTLQYSTGGCWTYAKRGRVNFIPTP